LLIGKSDPTRSDPAAQDAIFLNEILNHVLLPLIHPPRK
jgi:hypothetical protein